MKKIVLLIIFIIFGYVLIGNTIEANNLIPKDAIRIRIIANSNSDYDQSIKTKVKNNVQKDIYTILLNAKNIEEARDVIEKNLDSIEEKVRITLEQENYQLPFSVNFGYNYFPKKEFKGVTYKEGYYESLVITLGEGLGDNWWCVLFPPLCLLEAEDSTNVEYTTLAKELINKYF